MPDNLKRIATIEKTINWFLAIVISLMVVLVAYALSMFFDFLTKT